jgi:hypothetical protein
MQNALRSLQAGQRARAPSTGARVYSMNHTKRPAASHRSPACTSQSIRDRSQPLQDWASHSQDARGTPHHQHRRYAWGEAGDHAEAENVAPGDAALADDGNGTANRSTGWVGASAETGWTQQVARPRTARPFRIRTRMQQEMEGENRRVRSIQDARYPLAA